MYLKYLENNLELRSVLYLLYNGHFNSRTKTSITLTRIPSENRKYKTECGSGFLVSVT